MWGLTLARGGVTRPRAPVFLLFQRVGLLSSAGIRGIGGLALGSGGGACGSLRRLPARLPDSPLPRHLASGSVTDRVCFLLVLPLAGDRVPVCCVRLSQLTTWPSPSSVHSCCGDCSCTLVIQFSPFK